MFLMKDVCNNGSETTHDLNVTLEWFTTGIDILLCIVCTGVILLRKRKRLLHWMEAMRIMGMPLRFMLVDAAPWSIDQERGMILAGNAFSGFVVSPMVTSAYMALPFQEMADALTAYLEKLEEECLEEAGKDNSDEAEDNLSSRSDEEDESEGEDGESESISQDEVEAKEEKDSDEDSWG